MLDEDNPYKWGTAWKIWTAIYFLFTLVVMSSFLTTGFTQPDFTTLRLIESSVAYPTFWWIWVLTWIARRAVIAVRVQLALASE